MLTFQDMLYLKGLCSECDFFEEDSFHYCTLEFKGELPADYQTMTIRHFFAEHDSEINLKLARARSLLAWRRDYKYCSFCGTPLVDHAVQTARECPQCKKIHFPRIEYKHTLMDETYSFAIRAQKAFVREMNLPWGISETAYNELDDAQNYKYHAFGVPYLKFQNTTPDRIVISPYSSQLSMSS